MAASTKTSLADQGVSFDPYYFKTPNHIFLEKHFSTQYTDKLGSSAPTHSLEEFKQMANFPMLYHLNLLHCTNLNEQSIETYENIVFVEFISPRLLSLSAKLFLIDDEGRRQIKNATMIQCDFSADDDVNKYGIVVFLPLQDQSTSDLMYSLTLGLSNSSINLAEFFITHKVAGSKSFVEQLEEIELPEYNLNMKPVESDLPDIEVVSHKSSLIIFDSSDYVTLELKSSTRLKAVLVEIDVDTGVETRLEDRFTFVQEFLNDRQLVYASVATSYKRYKLKLFAKVKKQSLDYVSIGDFCLIRKDTSSETQVLAKVIKTFILDFFPFYVSTFMMFFLMKLIRINVLG